MWSSAGMWLQCIRTIGCWKKSRTLCRSTRCWGENMIRLLTYFKKYNLASVSCGYIYIVVVFNQSRVIKTLPLNNIISLIMVIISNTCQSVVFSQCLKELVVSVAAGLRHSLAVTGKLALCISPYVSLCIPLLLNPQILIFSSAFRLRLCVSVGNRSFWSS